MELIVPLLLGLAVLTACVGFAVGVSWERRRHRCDARPVVQVKAVPKGVQNDLPRRQRRELERQSRRAHP